MSRVETLLEDMGLALPFPKAPVANYLGGVDITAGQPTEIQVGTLSMPNLSGRAIAVCSPESQCFNEASAGWAGVVTPETKSLELPAGTYKLKSGNQFIETISVAAGQMLVLKE